MAGIGAAINTGGVTRGDTVAVIGCGGVGCAAVAGARLAGARTIIAVDIDDRKLEWATALGATHTVNSKSRNPVEAIHEICGGVGADVVIEAVGRPETYEQAFYARDLAGTVVLVGVPTPDMKIELPLIEVFGRGGALKSSWYGDCLPTRDFPMLVDLYLQGRLDLDRSSARRSGSATSKPPSRRCTAARSCAPWWSCDGRHRSPRHVRHLQPGRRHLGRRQQRLGDRRPRRGGHHRCGP